MLLCLRAPWLQQIELCENAWLQCVLIWQRLSNCPNNREGNRKNAVSPVQRRDVETFSSFWGFLTQAAYIVSASAYYTWLLRELGICIFKQLNITTVTVDDSICASLQNERLCAYNLQNAPSNPFPLLLSHFYLCWVSLSLSHVVSQHSTLIHTKKWRLAVNAENRQN